MFPAISNPHDDVNDDAPAWAVKIDYISLCSAALMHPVQASSEVDAYPSAVAALSLEGVGLKRFVMLPGHTWSFGAGRKAYPRSVRSASGAVLFYGAAAQPPLLELGGSACDALRLAGEQDTLVYNHWERFTRIDLAGDLESEISPEAFLAYGRSPRHKADGHDDSATGSTRYVGSPTSDRRLKVYRYYPPHPRSRFLRVEITLRRDLAKSAAAALADVPGSQVWQAACEPFSLKAPQWRLPSGSLRLQPTMKSEPTAASRLRWLIKQIKPAVIDAHKAGLINLTEWLSDAEAT